MEGTILAALAIAGMVVQHVCYARETARLRADMLQAMRLVKVERIAELNESPVEEVIRLDDATEARIESRRRAHMVDNDGEEPWNHSSR